MINSKLIDVFFDEHDGYPEELAGDDNPAAFRDACGDASRDFPQSLWIEPREWPAVAKEIRANKTRAIDYVNRFTNQSPTHECTCHSLVKNAECAYNRPQRLAIGPPVKGSTPTSIKAGNSVWLSCLSIYAEANPRKWGGASIKGVLEIAVRRGFLPDKIQPKNYNFKHTLAGTNGRGNACQSSGNWVRLSDFPEGWQETAANFRPKEIVFTEEWEQAVCLVLHGYCVSVGRSGHAVPYMEWDENESMMAYTDSYDIIRYDSLRTVKNCAGSGFSIITMTTPDDWNIPAAYNSSVTAQPLEE